MFTVYIHMYTTTPPPHTHTQAPLPSSSSYLPVSLTLASGDDVANLLVASDYAEVVSHSRGRPEATEGTSDLSAGMEQPSPPVGYLSPSPLTPGEEVVISVTFISGGGVIHANLLQEGEYDAIYTRGGHSHMHCSHS